MPHFVFTDPSYVHNSIDLSDHVIGMSLEYDADEVEDTAAGDTTHLFLPSGLLSYTLTVELAQDLAANDVDKTLFADIGVARTVVVRNDNSDGVSSTNPNYSATMILKSYPPMGQAIGDKAITKAVYIAGTALTRAEA